MSDNTGISWTDTSWNPIRGCSRVSEGCRHCYAEAQAARIVRMGRGKPTAYDGLVRTVGDEPRWTGEVRLVVERLADPLRWRKPRRIFVNSMSDLFHESLSNEQIAAVFGVMAAAPQHTFQLLTKRAKRMREWFAWANEFAIDQRDIAAAPNTFRTMLDAAYEVMGKPSKPDLDMAWRSSSGENDAWPLPSVHLGISVEDQDAADERIPELLMTPASVRFLSCEPLLGEVMLTHVRPDRCETTSVIKATDGHPRIDWVIAGCESGPGARPCDVAWLRSLRDQCAEAGVPYFLKQATEDAGALRPLAARDDLDARCAISFGPGSKRKIGGVIELPYLDGVQHAAFPVAQ